MSEKTPTHYVAIDGYGEWRMSSRDRIPARIRPYDWTVWAIYEDGSKSRVVGPPVRES